MTRTPFERRLKPVVIRNQPRDEHHCPGFRSCHDHPRWTVWKCNTDEHRTFAHSPNLPWIVNRPGPYHQPDAQGWHIEWHAATHQEAISLAHRKASE